MCETSYFSDFVVSSSGTIATSVGTLSMTGLSAGIIGLFVIAAFLFMVAKGTAKNKSIAVVYNVGMYICVVLAIVLGLSFREADEQVQPQGQAQMHSQPQLQASPDLHTVGVQDVIQASSYTYLNVKEGDNTFWMAIAKKDIKVGETISFAGGLEMKNFESKELQRTFETIYFVDRIVSGEPSAAASQQPAVMPHRMKSEIEKQEFSIEPAEGGITIGELFGNSDSYADKAVLIKGKVTKVNRAIMDRNWVHIQDGTSDSGKYDLTITTNEDVNVGEVVTFEGKITLNKDFGSGYSYEVIMEEARRKTE